MANRNKNRHKLERHIMAVLCPTYENAKKALRSMASEPDTISGDNIEDFMDRVKRPDAKNGSMSMLLAGDVSLKSNPPTSKT